ncbi:GIY-YIG nuclease family protein [Hyphomonas oceanitis]|nr:GIY-YIG nuclease family protein [Hyphomonas oceanitis]
MAFYVYMLASQRNGTLYIGQTDDLIRRVWQHRNKVLRGFTSKYDCHMLVWFADFPDRDSARSRERQMKAWKRKWKLDLIEANNPRWADLYEDLVSYVPVSPANAGAQSCKSELRS